MAEERWIGAHFCGDCWLAVAFGREGYAEAAVVDGVGDVWYRYEERAERVLVDVPIGLVGDGDGRRRCDELARELLGDRAGAVVSPPARKAARKRRYPVANRVNERKTGTQLSEAAFEMSDAVSVLDDLLGEFPAARETVAAAHPDLSVRAFAGHPPEYDPDTAGGYAERMRTLASLDRDAPPAVQSVAETAAGHDVTVADVLEATILAYTALPHDGRLRSLPPDPPLDETGLPMQIVYRSDASLVER